MNQFDILSVAQDQGWCKIFGSSSHYADLCGASPNLMNFMGNAQKGTRITIMPTIITIMVIPSTHWPLVRSNLNGSIAIRYANQHSRQ